jgi:hypothetical protein
MTPAELRERRRDLDLRRAYAKHQQEQERERLRRVSDEIWQLIPTYPKLAPILGMAFTIASQLIEKPHWSDGAK